MLHYISSQMSQSRVRRQEEDMQSRQTRRPSSSTRRTPISSTRPRSQSHSNSRTPAEGHSDRSRSLRSPRRRDEFYPLTSPMRLPIDVGDPFLVNVDPRPTSEGGERRPRRAITLSPHSGAQRPNLGDQRSESDTSGEGSSTTENADINPPNASAFVFMSRRNQRTFARPWRFHEIYSDWSLTCIHRIFWLSVAFIHIGIFLLFIGGFFHKTPSRLASSLVSLGIFILSSGLAMYTLAKSIIRARARQCERVLQVVLDFVEPPEGIHGNEPTQNADNITGVVDAPPPYEAPPPYPGPQGPAQGVAPEVDEPPDSTLQFRTDAVGYATTDNPAPTPPNCDSPGSDPKPEENGVDPSLGPLPPTYSSINIPDDVANCPEHGEMPPAYSELP